MLIPSDSPILTSCLSFIEGLLCDVLGAGEQVDVGFVALEFDGAFRQGQHPFAALDHDAGVGAVSGAHEDVFGNLHGRLHFEHDDAVVFGRFG